MGAYDIIYKVGNYYTNVSTIKAVGAGFVVNKNDIIEGLVATEGTATYGSATTNSATFEGIVLEGVAGSTFTFNNVNIGNMFYNNQYDFSSLLTLAVAPRATSKAVVIYDDFNGDGEYTIADLDIDNDGTPDAEELKAAGAEDGSTINFVPVLTGEDEKLEGTERDQKIALLKEAAIDKVVAYNTQVTGGKYQNGQVISASELQNVYIRLIDVTDPNKMITVQIKHANYGDEQSTVTSKAADASAGLDQPYKGFRYYKDGKVVETYVEETPKNDFFSGQSGLEFELIYDNSKLATYHNSAVSHNATYKGDASQCALIRDYNAGGEGGAPFAGFNTDYVNVVIEFGSTYANGSTLTLHENYGGTYNGSKVASVRFVHYTEETAAPTTTKVVLTKYLGLKLANETLIHSINDVKYYPSTDKVVAYNNVQFDLPTLKFAHAYLGEFDINAKYEILDKNGNLVSIADATGTFVNGLYTTLPLGNYTFRVTDIYNNVVNIPMVVHPRLTVDVGTNVSASIGLDAVKDGATINVDNSFDMTLTLSDGYELSSIFLNGNEITLSELLSINYNDLLGANMIKIRAKAIEYTITYKMVDDASYNEEGVFTMDMIKDGLQLPTPTVESGLRFLGWFIGDEKIENFEELGLTNAVVYGIVGVNQYNVTFDLGDNETYVQVVGQDGKAISYVPTKEGYAFGGWVDKDGNAYDFNTTLTADVTLTAVWTPKQDLTTEVAAPNDPIVNATVGEINNVNVMAIVCYVLLGVGGAGLVAVVVLAILKKKANKGEEVNEEI